MRNVIAAERIGKKYLLDHRPGSRFPTLRDAITEKARSLLTSFSRAARESRRDEFWALRDVSFSIGEGERVGIIGRNGAGKSTLLKILSRITDPTTGQARLRGRVASLLEVGTGFHPELTGRENVYLNGAVLGMGRHEIRRRFDEIVAFAEVERFLDTPVKRYSSGMYMRLAFAVAAHLEPEILIVDEVLAVGDAQFQRKCLGKMEELSQKAGRTIVFVSHNMALIQALCSRAFYLKQGGIAAQGPVDDVITRYMADVPLSCTNSLSERNDRTGKGNVRFSEIAITAADGSSNIAIGEDIKVSLVAKNYYDSDISVRFSLSIRDQTNQGLILCDSVMTGNTYRLKALTDSAVTCIVKAPPLNIGEYLVNIAVQKDNEFEDWITSAARFSIETGRFHDHVVFFQFPVLSRFEWHSRQL